MPRSRRCLFDSWYDTYQGVVILVRVVDGVVRPKQKIRLFSNSAVYEVQSVGVFTPKMQQTTELSPGEVGCIIAGIKRVRMPRSAIPSWMPIVRRTRRSRGTKT